MAVLHLRRREFGPAEQEFQPVGSSGSSQSGTCSGEICEARLGCQAAGFQSSRMSIKVTPASAAPLRTNTGQSEPLVTYPPNRKAQNATMRSCAVFAVADIRCFCSIAQYAR
jgi:hypothetical protein